MKRTTRRRLRSVSAELTGVNLSTTRLVLTDGAKKLSVSVEFSTFQWVRLAEQWLERYAAASEMERQWVDSMLARAKGAKA